MSTDARSDADTDPHQAIRRFWAQHCILMDPQDQRDWQSLPPDVIDQVLHQLDKLSLGAVRGACRAWNAAVNGSVRDLDVRCWPPKPQLLAHFTSLTRISLRGPYISSDTSRLELISPLLINLALLPQLKALDMSYPGPGSLENLDVLSGLTSLSLSRTHQSRPALASLDPAPAAAAAEALAAAAVPGAIPAPLQPAAAAAAGGGEEVEGEDIDAAAVAGPEPGVVAQAVDAVAAAASSSSSRSSLRGDFPMLPAALAQLELLQELKMDNMAPVYSVLKPLKQLKALELRGQTLRSRGGMLVACSPLPGIGALTQLTRLVARCNYGINRLPPDMGALGHLKYLDLSKNMLWALPTQMTLLTGLSHLDLSSNCLATIPEDISSLNRLTHLDLSNNSRVLLPRTLGRLGSLVQLNLNWVWTDLTALWEGSPGLSSLEVLSVVGNGVVTLPVCVGGFKKLRSFSLSMNNLTVLPDAIGSISSLQTLEVSDNRLSSLPADLGKLKGLLTLGLRSNALAVLPAEIGGLGALTYLDVSMNHLTELPPSISQLASLQQLALSMNPLQHLPPGLTNLTALRILEMYYVHLEPEVPPSSSSSSSSSVLSPAAAAAATTAATAGGVSDGGNDHITSAGPAAGGTGVATSGTTGGSSSSSSSSSSLSDFGAATTAREQEWARGPLRRLQSLIPGLYVFSNTMVGSLEDPDSPTDHSPAWAPLPAAEAPAAAVAIAAGGGHGVGGPDLQADATAAAAAIALAAAVEEAEAVQLVLAGAAVPAAGGWGPLPGDLLVGNQYPMGLGGEVLGGLGEQEQHGDGAAEGPAAAVRGDDRVEDMMHLLPGSEEQQGGDEGEGEREEAVMEPLAQQWWMDLYGAGEGRQQQQQWDHHPEQQHQQEEGLPQQEASEVADVVSTRHYGDQQQQQQQQEEEEAGHQREDIMALLMEIAASSLAEDEADELQEGKQQKLTEPLLTLQDDLGGNSRDQALVAAAAVATGAGVAVGACGGTLSSVAVAHALTATATAVGAERRSWPGTSVGNSSCSYFKGSSSMATTVSSTSGSSSSTTGGSCRGTRGGGSSCSSDVDWEELLLQPGQVEVEEGGRRMEEDVEDAHEVPVEQDAGLAMGDASVGTLQGGGGDMLAAEGLSGPTDVASSTSQGDHAMQLAPQWRLNRRRCCYDDE